jgi:hypothetical protein
MAVDFECQIMRDNSQNMIELVRTFESDGHFFAVFCICIDSSWQNYQIGVQKDAQAALQKVFQKRPFDSLPGVKYRYFFTGTCSNGKDTGQPSMQVRIESEGQATSEHFHVPIELLQNLVWFSELSDSADASHLLEPQ